MNIPTTLDLCVGKLPNPKVTIATLLEKVKAYEALQPGKKQALQPADSLTLTEILNMYALNIAKSAPGVAKRLVITIEDDSFVNVWIKIAPSPTWRYIFSINGYSSCLNNFAIKVDTPTEILLQINSEYVVSWTYGSFASVQNEFIISKKLPLNRQFYINHYKIGQSINKTADYYVFQNSDRDLTADKLFLKVDKYSPEKYPLDWKGVQWK